MQTKTLFAGAQCAVFLLLVVLNYLATSEEAGAVAFTNAQVADTHPVYGLPNGWAFAIWGIIFIALGMYTLYQALPARCYGGLDCEHVANIRMPVFAMELLNCGWNFLFGWEQYWMALLNIVLYDMLLFIVLRRLNINYFMSIPNMSKWHAIRTKVFVVMPFSVHAGWVTVATALNVQVNALEEGWMPSPGFSIGACWTAVTLGICLTVYPYADLPYTLVTLWALGGIISNQSPDTSTFGCLSRICGACNEAAVPICARFNTAHTQLHRPNGWADLNCAANWNGTWTGTGTWGTGASQARNDDPCVLTIVPKSPEVVWWSVAGMFTVVAVFVMALVNARCFGYMPLANTHHLQTSDEREGGKPAHDAHQFSLEVEKTPPSMPPSPPSSGGRVAPRVV